MFYRSHTNEVHDKFRYDFENLETKYYLIFIFISKAYNLASNVNQSASNSG